MLPVYDVSFILKDTDTIFYTDNMCLLLGWLQCVREAFLDSVLQVAIEIAVRDKCSLLS